MSKKKRLPFQNLGEEAWQNLAIAALFVVYIVQIAWSIMHEGPLASSIGLDFRAFWSAGYISNTAGYADAYNLAILIDVQKQIVPLANYHQPFEVAPVAILPVFLTIFQVFALGPAVSSFYIWSALNIIGFVLYLRFFFLKLDLPNWQRFTIIALLCFPVFLNLFWGQINLLLLICSGEFIRHILGKREIRAGLWLGGLILKPQLIILIGPVLLLQRKWRLLSGFSVTILFVLVSSLLLGKPSSLINLFGIMTKFASGIPTNAPENMMNWRMVGIQLSSILPPTISFGLAVAGLAGTMLAIFLLWRKPLPSSSSDFLVAFTGLLAATAAVTWHSHIHIAMILIPPILYLSATHIFPRNLFNWWMFGLAFINIFLALTGLSGLSMLIINLVILAWAWRIVKSKRLLL